jgi:hypothetical protein
MWREILPYRNEEDRAFDEVAEVLVAPFSDNSHVKKKLAETWESAKDGKTLDDCLDYCLDEYARNIDTEIGYTRERKIIALAIELKQSIRRKATSS